MAPSTFASAAAGNSTNSARTDSGGDWSRRANGNTQTFRRSSHATTLSGSTLTGSSREGSASQNTSTSNTGVYVPPHVHSSRNGSSVESRYSKDQLMHIFKSQKDPDDINDGLSSLYVGTWEPHISNGTSSASWGRKEDLTKESQTGVDICWDHDGSSYPVGLNELTEEEKETFFTSVNSPLKPPIQGTKEATPKDGLSLRKTSISQSQNASGSYGLASPTNNRPSNRRRDTGDAYPFPSSTTASPAPASRFSREEPNTVTPPPALVRRRTDFKETTAGSASEDREKEKPRDENSGPFGSLKRTTTAPFSSGTTGPSSPWAATSQGAGFSPMTAFGNFNIGGGPAQSTPTEKRPGFGSMRGESRFKGLMSKDSSEDIAKSAKEKSSLGNLGKVSDADPGKPTPSWMEARSNRPTSNDTDPFPDDDLPTGSAALGGGQDMSPPRHQGISAFGTPSRQEPRDDPGFSAFGMTSDTTGLRDVFHGRDNYQHHTPQQHSLGRTHEPMSPTDTNPYQSPDHDRTDSEDIDTDGSEIQNAPFPGLGSFQADPSVGPGLPPFSSLGNLGRVSGAYEPAASDRSQTSSVGPSRVFPTLGGLGGLPGLGGASVWPTGPPAMGTPVRERAGFGTGFDGIFGSVGEIQSPGLAGLGSSSLFSPGSAAGLSGSGTIGRGSKLGSLFPAGMQEQMRSGDQSRPANDDGSIEGDRQQNAPGHFGRNAFGNPAPGSLIPSRDAESPFRSARGAFDDYPSAVDGGNRSIRNSDSGFSEAIGTPFGQMMSSAAAQSSTMATAGQGNIGQQRTSQPPASSQSQIVSSPASNQPPAAQQRTMVMPDRMRWIYRDPQGNTQGPWSGLEMHDWYKAGFFSPELLVKKYEDPDYEPLAQLIRRIGNSREPFLVPQIGIPHGPPSTQAGNAWAGGSGLPAGATAGAGAQPPFAGSFPSFGTTLTAEQQNALERRKQEEQYLMARQKEHLAAQQQVMAKQAQMGIGPHGILPQPLHHHSSAHSLHSQPSFGSITSPGGYQPSPTQGPMPGGPPVPGLFDSPFRAAPVPGLGPIGAGMDVLSNIREEDVPGMMDRLNLGRGGQLPFGGAPMPFGQQQPDSNAHAQQVVAMLNDRARLQREQAEHDAMQRLSQNDQQAAQASADRLQQFHDLRLQTDLDQASSNAPPEGVIGKPTGPSTDQIQHQHRSEILNTQSEIVAPGGESALMSKPSEPLSLTEQVQKAASAKQSPAPQSPWAKVEALSQPFPPPPSQSPLPAPAAQRKQNVADALNAESRSRSETPSIDTPSASIAPWAKEPTEAPKGPSLKEIQEAEARKAAQQEEIAAAARRAALEKEYMTHTISPAAAPGLPSSSTWASGASPITPLASTPSAWAKPLAGKAPGQQGAGAKKTLQQIQKEEEARKQRAAAAANVANATAPTVGVAPPLSSGKRYADLAGKHTPPTAPTQGGGAWTTVGASGKAKATGVPIPTGPAAGVRSTSSGIIPTAPVKPKPLLTGSRSATMGGGLASQVNAQEEFKKWAIGELKGDLGKGINADEFVSGLLSFPQDLEILVEAVHSASNTIDSRHFAEEFLRRRKLADKGIVDTSAAVASPADTKAGGGGGWSEVAKKGGQNVAAQQGALDTGNFKVVAAKKKGGKR
ncbi:hypothetical protein K432DRAFT_378700 [Lepidopterella palustris CBS 459.81]|uniref:GYF domain-containing protein n=1 Tax=Lepidopterella palustris CBS 459.81 TaxID=1314670 RepID=A0A8E2EI94_9PEZI|nr:hypothetical protein K432DRAFT_378700 [Lepidopterella palustris CBS 459.81]